LIFLTARTGIGGSFECCRNAILVYVIEEEALPGQIESK